MSKQNRRAAKEPNAWNIPTPPPQPSHQKSKKTAKNPKVDKTTTSINKKFQEAHNRNVEKAKAFTQNCESSSEEEDELNHEELLGSVFRSYSGQSNELSKTQSFLENIFQSGSAICLICIGTVKRADSIWSCKDCYCFFHLLCVQRWANDSLYQQKARTDQEQSYYNRAGELIVKKVKPSRWCCPKCRAEYQTEDVPKVYSCFCSKVLNPPYHPWYVPHSCGEVCGKPLFPECGHTCVLLCHPGPCPPCPQFIQTSCKCERSSIKAIRCFQKSWTCDKKCGRVLMCGMHVCEQTCHFSDECPPCTRKSVHKCNCGNETMERNCYELEWKCKKVCNKLYRCGRHKCRKVCHIGDCGDCPLGLPRTCPCGKSQSTAPCSEVIDTCGDTCQKVLACGEHFCAQRCHKGDCSLCLAIVEKKCRCGHHAKPKACSKTFSCETKCKQMRDCKKHACNKKCCDGQCPPCDKVCSKTLSCKKHKCKSICHDGLCYPCELKSQVKCRCGTSSITIPCGRERKTRPPKCMQPCRISSKCHHQNPHRCHFNDCPTCSQKCNLPNTITNCKHPCEAKCHGAVKVQITDKVPASIWDWPTETFEIKALPHPKCEIKVEVTCIGGHETALWPCWNSTPSSCLRTCNRKLTCGNHFCELPCHAVPDISLNEQQEGCGPCERGCNIPRPEGCIHPCRGKCHQPPCTTCSAIIRTNCHCGLTQVYYKCNEYYNDISIESLAEIREKLTSCGNRCIKNYQCEHRCTSICHSGVCPNSDLCKKKIKIYCSCKNLKNEITCEKYRAGAKELPCGELCLTKKSNEERIRLEKEEKLKQIEEEQNRLELEQFEKKFGKKKYRERKQVIEVNEKRSYFKLWLGVAVSAAILSAFLMIYHF